MKESKSEIVSTRVAQLLCTWGFLAGSLSSSIDASHAALSRIDAEVRSRQSPLRVYTGLSHPIVMAQLHIRHVLARTGTERMLQRQIDARVLVVLDFRPVPS